MLEALGLDVTRVLEIATTICKSKGSQPIAAMKEGVLGKRDADNESLEGCSLYAASTRVQTMPCKLAIERFCVAQGVVW